jgi:Major Facilitator Superfamily
MWPGNDAIIDSGVSTPFSCTLLREGLQGTRVRVQAGERNSVNPKSRTADSSRKCFANTVLPPGKRPLGLALFGITATLGPAVGPYVGGFLTDSFGWQMVFYVNFLPGAVMLAAIAYAIDSQPPNLKLLKQGDWLGIACIRWSFGFAEKRNWPAAHRPVIEGCSITYHIVGSLPAGVPLRKSVRCLRRG